MAASTFPWPPVRRCADQTVRLEIWTRRPAVSYLIRKLEQPDKLAAVPESISKHSISEAPITFRMWARDSPRACDECKDDKGCKTLIPNLDEKNSVQVLCDECTTRTGELWVDVVRSGWLELGETGTNVVYRPRGIMLGSFRALKALY